MFPWGKDEEAAFGTGLEVLMSRLGESIKAPGGEEDEGEVGIEGGAHDGLFAFGDGWRDEHSPLPCFGKEKSHLLCHLFIGEASGALHLQFLWIVEEELIANGCIVLPCNTHTKANTEKVRVFTFDGKAKRVGAEIVEPPLEFVFARKDVVVVAKAPQHALLAVVKASVSLFPLFSLQRQRRSRLNTKNKAAIVLVGACLKTLDDMS